MDANNIMTGIPLHVYEPEEEDYSVYIVLSKTQTLPSRVIKLWTREPYAHTSLAMDVELKEMYSFARKHLHNPFDCGFINEDITTGVFGRDVQTTCRIGRLRVTKQQYEKIMEILEQFKSEKVFYRYNYSWNFRCDVPEVGGTSIQLFLFTVCIVCSSQSRNSSDYEETGTDLSSRFQDVRRT